mgnify:CR=1 FL=1
MFNVSATGHTTARWIGLYINCFLLLQARIFRALLHPTSQCTWRVAACYEYLGNRKAQLPLVVVSWQRNKFWRRVHHTLQGMQAGVKPAAPLGDGSPGSREPALIKIRGQHTKPCCTMLVRVR